MKTTNIEIRLKKKASLWTRLQCTWLFRESGWPRCHFCLFRPNNPTPRIGFQTIRPEKKHQLESWFPISFICVSGMYFNLSVDFHAGLAAKLFSDEVSVVAGVDVVVVEGLVHVHVNVQPVQDDRGVLVRHHVVEQGVHSQLFCKKKVEACHSP